MIRKDAVWILLAVLGAELASPLSAGALAPGAGEILLLEELQSAAIDSAEQQLLSDTTTAWQPFRARRWAVLWNETTRTPQRALGPDLPFWRDTLATAGAGEVAARAFVDSNQALLGLPSAGLFLRRSDEENGRHYVSFVQRLGRFEVLFTEVELRFWPGGEVFAFGSKVYPGLVLPPRPPLSKGDAARAAITGLDTLGFQGIVIADSSSNLRILPYRTAQGVEARFVFEFFVLTGTPAGQFTTLVDARTGETLRRRNLIRHAWGRTLGSVVAFDGSGKIEDFAHVKIQWSDGETHSNAWGRFVLDSGSATTLTARLESPYFQILDGLEATPAQTVELGSSPGVIVFWSDANSSTPERNAFYFLNLARDRIYVIDPDETGLSAPIVCRVDGIGSCNVSYDFNENEILLSTKGACEHAGLVPSLILHEYGHAVNKWKYVLGEDPWGVASPAADEGMADVLAALILDDPIIGSGYKGADSYERDLSLVHHFDDLIYGTTHELGQVLGASFWNFREKTSPKLAFRLSHHMKAGVPGDLNDQLTFGEILYATLIADKVEGYTGGISPHDCAIVASFEEHGIQLSWTDHDVVPDCPDD